MSAPYGLDCLRLDLEIEYDAETQSYAAWCDRLGVATSAPTAGHAQEMLLDAILQATDFVLRNRNSLRHEMLGQVVAAELLQGLSEQELREFICAHVHVRADHDGPAQGGVRADGAERPHVLAAH